MPLDREAIHRADFDIGFYLEKKFAESIQLVPQEDGNYAVWDKLISHHPWKERDYPWIDTKERLTPEEVKYLEKLQERGKALLQQDKEEEKAREERIRALQENLEGIEWTYTFQTPEDLVEELGLPKELTINLKIEQGWWKEVGKGACLQGFLPDKESWEETQKVINKEAANELLAGFIE